MGIGRKWVDRSIDRLLGPIALSIVDKTQAKQAKAEAAEKAKIAKAKAAEQAKMAKDPRLPSNRAVKKKPSGKMEKNLAQKKPSGKMEKDLAKKKPIGKMEKDLAKKKPNRKMEKKLAEKNAGHILEMLVNAGHILQTMPLTYAPNAGWNPLTTMRSDGNETDDSR
jgi:hypothetical protein